MKMSRGLIVFLLTLVTSISMTTMARGTPITLGASYTDSTTLGTANPVRYDLSITFNENGTFEASMSVSGVPQSWTLDWVKFKLGGVSLNNVRNFVELPPEGVLTGNWSGNIPNADLAQFSLKAWYISPNEVGQGKGFQTNQLSTSMRVPEPGTLLLLGSGLLGIAAYGFARSRKQR